jgi:hypothetical protein
VRPPQGLKPQKLKNRLCGTAKSRALSNQSLNGRPQGETFLDPAPHDIDFQFQLLDDLIHTLPIDDDKFSFLVNSSDFFFPPYAVPLERRRPTPRAS